MRKRRCVVLDLGGQNEGISHTSHRKPVPCVPRCSLKVSKDSGGDEIAFVNTYGQLATIESTPNALLPCTQNV